MSLRGFVDAALSGVLAVAVTASIGLLVACESDEPRLRAVATIMAPTQTTPRTPEPTPAPSPPSVVPDGPVAFKVCGETIGYRKLTPAEMQSVFTNKRFGDGVKPGPFYWAIYQSDYYWIRLPQAISAKVENAALGRGTTTAGGITISPPPRCPTPDERQSESYQALWLYDHRGIRMLSTAGVLTVEVEGRSGSWQNVEFPEPAPPRSMRPGKSDGSVFTGLRVVDQNGHVLVSRGQNADSWEFDDQGQLRSGTVSASGSSATVNFRVPADLEFFCGAAHRAAAEVTAVSATGRTIKAHAVCAGSWEAAASMHLEPGDWTISAEGGAFHTVLPKDGPRP